MCVRINETTFPAFTYLEVQGVRVKRNFVTERGYAHTGSVLYVDIKPVRGMATGAGAGGRAVGLLILACPKKPLITLPTLRRIHILCEFNVHRKHNVHIVSAVQ
jgi:hypothetical protein